jgi:hypothetical protein
MGGQRFGLHRRFLCSFSGLVGAVPLTPTNFLEALLLGWLQLLFASFLSEDASLKQAL